MLSRFKQNVRTYPRTATVLGVVYALAIMIAVTVARHQLLALVGAVLIIGGFDFLTYIWVMSDSRRLSVLLETLEEFEGRGESEDDCDGKCDLWNDEDGQDIAEYAVMMAVLLVIVIGTIRLIGSSANNVFSAIGSQIQ
jgi:Flp pilus assembly pilin Flp